LGDTPEGIKFGLSFPLIDGTKKVVEMVDKEKDDPAAFNRLIEKNETRG